MSEDCISRQAVETLVDELTRAISDERCGISRGRSTATIMRDIRHLSSVIPAEKIGHWIMHEEIDGYGKVISWHCDKCYKDNGFTTDYKWDFCPNCGAKMVELQESENKE